MYHLATNSDETLGGERKQMSVLVVNK